MHDVVRVLLIDQDHSFEVLKHLLSGPHSDQIHLQRVVKRLGVWDAVVALQYLFESALALQIELPLLPQLLKDPVHVDLFNAYPFVRVRRQYFLQQVDIALRDTLNSLPRTYPSIRSRHTCNSSAS